MGKFDNFDNSKRIASIQKKLDKLNRKRKPNRRLTFRGETHCLSEWGEIVGISHKTIGARINAYGWSIERALTTPVRGSENER